MDRRAVVRTLRGATATVTWLHRTPLNIGHISHTDANRSAMVGGEVGATLPLPLTRAPDALVRTVAIPQIPIPEGVGPAAGTDRADAIDTATDGAFLPTLP